MANKNAHKRSFKDWEADDSCHISNKIKSIAFVSHSFTGNGHKNALQSKNSLFITGKN